MHMMHPQLYIGFEFRFTAVPMCTPWSSLPWFPPHFTHQHIHKERHRHPHNHKTGCQTLVYQRLTGRFSHRHSRRRHTRFLINCYHPDSFTITDMKWGPVWAIAIREPKMFRLLFSCYITFGSLPQWFQQPITSRKEKKSTTTGNIESRLMVGHAV